MSPKKKKSSKRKKSHNKNPSLRLVGKKDVKRVTLAEKLRRVYEDTIDLSTTCQGRCECCKAACPAMNYCEFSQLIKEVWDKESQQSKTELICTSIEYFFKNEFEKWGIETLNKPCMLLNDEGVCKYYKSRPLSCRMYGQWPDDVYKARVDKFEKAYEGLLKREELPLNTQCPFVERVDKDEELTAEIIEDLYAQLDDLDRKVMKRFSEVQISAKENYRTFHDWLLYQTFGEEWLSTLTTFTLAADKETIESQIVELKKAIREQFGTKMPDLDI